MRFMRLILHDKAAGKIEKLQKELADFVRAKMKKSAPINEDAVLE
jgi:hypothetical protein